MMAESQKLRDWVASFSAPGTARAAPGVGPTPRYLDLNRVRSAFNRMSCAVTEAQTPTEKVSLLELDRQNSLVLLRTPTPLLACGAVSTLAQLQQYYNDDHHDHVAKASTRDRDGTLSSLSLARWRRYIASEDGEAGSILNVALPISTPFITEDEVACRARPSISAVVSKETTLTRFQVVCVNLASVATLHHFVADDCKDEDPVLKVWITVSRSYIKDRQRQLARLPDSEYLSLVLKEWSASDMRIVVQGVGESVFVPAGMPHAVLTVTRRTRCIVAALGTMFGTPLRVGLMRAAFSTPLIHGLGSTLPLTPTRLQYIADVAGTTLACVTPPVRRLSLKKRKAQTMALNSAKKLSVPKTGDDHDVVVSDADK